MKATLALSLESGNAAFAEDPRAESISILKDFIALLEEGEDEHYGPIRDTNGNQIGECGWMFEEEEELDFND